MIKEILNIEKIFSNNEYFGTNVWTEEKYRVISGKKEILLSAPHSVNQFREDDIRSAEKYTGSLVKYIANKLDIYGIYEIFTHADPNNNEDNCLYKNAVINIVNLFGIKLLIDVHSSTFKDDTDVDIVTNLRQTLCGNDKIIDDLKFIADKYGLKIDENNKPNKEKAYEVIGITSYMCNIPALRIVFNNKSLDFITNPEKAEKIIMFLEDFLSNYEI